MTSTNKTSSQIPAENTQNSLNPNAAAFEPNQPSKVSSRLSLGNAHSSQKVTSSSQALATSKAPDIKCAKGMELTASFSQELRSNANSQEDRKHATPMYLDVVAIAKRTKDAL
ncbi:MAG: hypothetical protein FRX49_08379 [Trebouxia sp. A1-2]|nr:MAG: hypothetical protein FRX49_08379 [Trebouxia sp. A1-2]